MADRLHPPYHNTPSQIRSTSANLNVLLACALLLLLRDPPNAFGSPSHPFEFRTIRVPHNSSSPPTVPSYHLEATTFCLPWKIEGAASNHIPGPPFVSRFRKISPPQTGPHILRSVVCTYSILPEASRPRQAGLFIASLSASVFAAFPKASSTDQNLSGIILRISDRHCFRADFGRTAHSSSTPIISLDRVCRLSSVSTNNRLCFRSQLVPATSKITAALVIPFDKVGTAKTVPRYIPSYLWPLAFTSLSLCLFTTTSFPTPLHHPTTRSTFLTRPKHINLDQSRSFPVSVSFEIASGLDITRSFAQHTLISTSLATL